VLAPESWGVFAIVPVPVELQAARIKEKPKIARFCITRSPEPWIRLPHLLGEQEIPHPPWR
jgi:hypothetical protein